MPRCQYKYPWGKQCDSNKAYYHQVKKKYLCLAHAEIEEQKKPLTKAQRVKQLKKLSPLDQIMQDVVALARFYRNPGDDRLGEFLKKLFRTVIYGGLLFWHIWDIPSLERAFLDRCACEAVIATQGQPIHHPRIKRNFDALPAAHAVEVFVQIGSRIKKNLSVRIHPEEVHLRKERVAEIMPCT